MYILIKSWLIDKKFEFRALDTPVRGQTIGSIAEYST